MLTSHNGSQVSTCSGMSAIEHANSKFSKGYSTTGVVCATCTHEFVLPEGAGPLQKGERSVSALRHSWFSVYALSGMPMSTTLLSGARVTTSSQRRSLPTISCVNGRRTFASGCKNFPSMMLKVWTTRSSPGWYRSFTSPHIVRSVAPVFHSTMSREPGGEIWRVRSGRGSDSRVVGVPKIKAPDFGVMPWMTSSVIGTGRSSFASVCLSHGHSREENAEPTVLTKVHSSQRSTQTQLSKPSSMRMNCLLSTKHCPRPLSNYGQRKSQHGRTTEVPKILTIYPRRVSGCK